jgi:AcrR family transcriptional regulator
MLSAVVATNDLPGLRERKKQRTHDDLQRIATRLFAERGYHDVTIEEIAAEADVSHRTFYRYFGSKEDLVLGSVADLLEAMEAALAARPRDESVMDSIRAATVSLASEFTGDAADDRTRIDIVQAAPELQQRSIERQPLMEAVLVPFVAERLGLDPETDLAPRVIASCCIAASRAALDVWVAQGSTTPIVDHIDAALRLVDDGLHLSGPAAPATRP